MVLLIFDTETTRLFSGKICQLSYVIIHNGSYTAKNFYFKVNYIEPDAQLIHGLSVDILDNLSSNKRFYEYSAEIKSDFEGADIVIAHNYEFDMKYIITEFSRCKQRIRINKGLCTMKHFACKCHLECPKRHGFKYPKLEELACSFNISRDTIKDKVKDIYGISGKGFHDARFDVVATYLCYLKASELGYIDQ